MSLQTENKVEKSTNNNTREKSTSRLSDNDEQSSTSSEDIAPSPKRRNQKRTPPTISTVPQRKSTRNRQSALSTAFGNPVPINTISDKNNDGQQKSFRFEIDSPPDEPKTENYPSLKSLIQEMGFAEKSPQYQACVKFIEAISPKNSTKETDVVDLTSPTENVTIDNNNDILLVKDKEQNEGDFEKKDEK